MKHSFFLYSVFIRPYFIFSRGIGNICNKNRIHIKVVIITGGGSGLGQATALQLAKEGAKLSLVDLNEKGLEETKAKISEVAPTA